MYQNGQNRQFMKRLIQIVALLALSLSAKAQGAMSLEQAILYAKQNSLDIKIQEQANASTHQERIEAVASLLPSLSATSSIYNSYGRSIDPETNTYTTVGNLSNSYGVSSSMTLFSGLKKINALKASQLKVEMGSHSTEQIEDAVAIDVMQLYFDALYYAQSVEIVESQRAAAQELLRLTAKQEELGIKSSADVALSASQVASYDLLLTQQEGLHMQAMLNLKEAMNFPFNEELTLSHEESTPPATLEGSFDIESNPEYQVALSQMDISRTNLRIAQGSYAPTLTLGAGYNNYYYTSFAEGYTPPSLYEQFKTNYGYYVGASLSIPIFNNLSYRTTVARSRHSLRTSQIELQKIELKVSKAANQALLNRNNYHKEQLSARAKVEASEIAHAAMLRKFEQGVATIIDLQSTSNELLKARAEELRAKFNYHIESYLVNYYFNNCE